MVKYLLLLILPAIVFSGEFIATVNRNQIGSGESVTLILTLKDASANSAPATSSLKKSFMINSQQQSSNTSIINGTMSSNITWKYVLIPLIEGDIEIPSISIDTPEGILSSNPVTIHVNKGNSNADPVDISLKANISNFHPYKNEPFTYTVKLLAKQEVANIQMQKFEIEGAIVEANGEPKVYEKVLNGMRAGIIEFSFLVTPLKPGKLTIPSLVIQGGTPIRGRFAFDNFHIQGMDRLKPFVLETEEIALEVKPAAEGVTPWLPAKSLEIGEIWNDSQTFQVGEPITRGVNILAEGVKASQLPNLKDLQGSDSNFKIYADNPETVDEVKEGKIKSYRKEQYTLIPQQSGSFTLPEIAVTWWDVNKNEKAVAKIPSRTINIAPASAIPIIHHAKEIQVTATNPILYVFGILLLVAGYWVYRLQRKIQKLTRNEEAPIQQKLPTITTPKQLLEYLQAWAHKHCDLPVNSPLNVICDALRQRSSEKLHEEITMFEKQLEEGLYRDKDIDIKSMIDTMTLLLRSKAKTSTRAKKEILPDLNPT